MCGLGSKSSVTLLFKYIQHLLFTELELSQKHIPKALFAVTDKDNAKMHLV